MNTTVIRDSQDNYLSSTNTYSDLCVYATTPEQRESGNHEYMYLLTDRAISYTAFKSKTEFVQWLAERNMLDAVEIPYPNSGRAAYFSRPLRETRHRTESALPHSWSKPFFKMENARYMLAYCIIDEDGVSNVHYANVNDKDSIQISPLRGLPSA